MKADLRLAHIRTIERAWLQLRAVELDLQVLGSELSPNLHEINRQLDELRAQMDQDRLDDQGSNDGHPEDNPAPLPTNRQPGQNGGQDPADDSPGQTIKQDD